MTVEVEREYLPAAGHDWLLPLYDPIIKLLGGEAARQQLLDQVALRPGQRVLELGSGTGTLSVMLKRRSPAVEVVGIDPDPKALKRARQKAARAGFSIQFDQGFGDQLPYPDGSFDAVFSSFVFHHIPADEKANTLRTVRRVLKPGGEFHLLDFEGPGDGKQGFLARLLHSNDRLHDNTTQRVIALLAEAGFSNTEKTGRRRMLFGSIAYYRARA